MAVHEYEVYNLSEFLEVNTEISRLNNKHADKPKVLWYRGQRKFDWLLQPTLYRNHSESSDAEIEKARMLGNVSTLSVQEEIRKQHFIGKNYHHIQKDLSSSLEWFEIMQHHGVGTRIMDWSESLMHSLIFTLECFIDNSHYKSQDRLDSKPCMWILEPIPWNIKAIDLIINDPDVIKECVDSIQTSESNKSAIQRRMKALPNYISKYMEIGDAKHLEYLFNLGSIIQDFNRMDTAELVYRLKDGEYYYCLFYLIKFVYLDHGRYDCEKILPLGFVESYHSERIKAQKGTFSIFPYYEETDHLKKMKSLNIHLDAMENMDLANEYLHKVIIGDPHKMAYELLGMGADDTWLYPEMPVAANTIELRKVLT